MRAAPGGCRHKNPWTRDCRRATGTSEEEAGNLVRCGFIRVDEKSSWTGGARTTGPHLSSRACETLSASSEGA